MVAKASKQRKTLFFALRRQRSQVRILSGAPATSDYGKSFPASWFRFAPGMSRRKALPAQLKRSSEKSDAASVAVLVKTASR
jgi:hypothetical protein